MNSTEAPLTVRQGVVIASRALCFYCLLEAMFNLSYFPGYIGGLQHAWRELSNLGLRDNYILGVYVRDLAVGTIRLAIEIFLAWWFYRCGPAVTKFLLGDGDETAAGSGDEDESLETQG